MTGTSTVHLGQFTDEHANEIAGKLEAAGIAWWYKQPGYFSRIWERGTRLFVDAERLEEAKVLAREVLAKDRSEPGAGKDEGGPSLDSPLGR